MENLKLLREERGVTQREFSQKLGISKTTLCYYEQGKVSPSIEMLIKLANYFNCSIDYLVGHQTKNILYLDSYTSTQRRIVEAVKDLSEDESYQLLGYIARMKDVPLEVILLKKRADEEG